jgi:hypothetical protein
MLHANLEEGRTSRLGSASGSKGAIAQRSRIKDCYETYINGHEVSLWPYGEFAVPPW